MKARELREKVWFVLNTIYRGKYTKGLFDSVVRKDKPHKPLGELNILSDGYLYLDFDSSMMKVTSYVNPRVVPRDIILDNYSAELLQDLKLFFKLIAVDDSSHIFAARFRIIELI